MIADPPTVPAAAAAAGLTSTAASLQRLDDKKATGMTIAEAARARWLTPVEVLQYLDRARSDHYVQYPWCTDPPIAMKPKSGTILLYTKKETPNYQEDGIEWVSVSNKWKSIERVLGKGEGESSSDGDGDGATNAYSDTATNASGMSHGDASGMSHGDVEVSGGPTQGTTSTSALVAGARAEYLTSTAWPTFHRREYRGPNNIVLLHYLDSVKALRMTNDLADRIICLSADAGSSLPPVIGSSADPTTPAAKSTSATPGLGDTIGILMEMVDEHEAPGTAVAEAVDEHVMKAVTDAAFSAVVKHMAPDEAMGVVDAMEVAIEDALPSDLMAMGDMGDGSISGTDAIEDVTAFEIDEAIDQVLSGNVNVEDLDGDGDEGTKSSKCSAVSSSSSSSSSGKKSKRKETAEMIEDAIVEKLDEVLPDDLQGKLVATTERVLDAMGVSLDAAKGDKKGGTKALAPPGAPPPTIASPQTAQLASNVNKPLPEITNVTPDFHTQGYQPAAYDVQMMNMGWNPNKMHEHYMVISTETPLPALPPYVDQYYAWERLVAFVDFQKVADDPLIRNISFNRMIPLTPYSHQVKMPSDIPNYSVRHIVVIGLLFPKDHRVKRKWPGIELALKLTLQTEWFAGWDLTGWESAPKIKGLERPVFMAPCGGNRLQLLTQISKMRFTNYPASSLPPSLTAAIPPEAKPSNFVQRVAITAAAKASTDVPLEKAIEAKRKRDNYIEEFVSTPGVDATMTTSEVDKHRKVRFVERISTALLDSKGESQVLLNNDLDVDGSETLLNGVKVENLEEDEIDDLLGRVLMRYVQVCIERCTTKEELLSEINWSGYAGLSLLHHACFYNFMALVTLLINNGADTNILSAEGDLMPLHFAAVAGHRDVVDVLIQHGCNPIALDINNETPADHARKAGHVEIAAKLSAYNEQAGMMSREDSNEGLMVTGKPSTTSDVFLQSAFKELSLKDKLGLNLFVDRGNAAASLVRQSSTSMLVDAGTAADDALESPNAFSFISDQDRARLREAMSLASEMDLQEMNTKADHQDVRRYLRQSNYEAINAVSLAMEKTKKKEADVLKSASQTTDDPSKMQLSRALAMLVLRKNLPQSK